MTEKPILEVDLDDTEFTNFQKKYFEFEKSLKDTASTWEQVGHAAEHDAEVFEKINEFMRRHHQAMEEADDALDDMNSKARRAGDSGMTFGKVASKFRDNIAGTTKSVLKWSGVAAVFSTVFAGGGLVGFGRLTSSTARERLETNQLGVTYGERSAFGASFSRLGDTDSLLRWAGEAQRDPEKRWILGANSGGQSDRLAQMSTPEAIIAMLPSIQRRMQGAPAASIDQVARAFGIPTSLARVLRNMSPGELTELISHYHSDMASMSLPPGVLRKWNDLDTVIDEAESAISTAFINKMVKLTPAMDKFVGAAMKFVDKILEKGGPLEQGLEPITKNLKWFADSISSIDFEHDADLLGRSIASFAWDVGRLLNPRALDPVKTPVEGTPTPPMSPQAQAEDSRRRVREQAQSSPALVPGGAGSEYEPQEPGRPPGAKSVPWGKRFSGSTKYHDQLTQSYVATRPSSSTPAPTAPSGGGAMPDNFTPKSKRELSGVDKPLAEAMVAASKDSGIPFQVSQGRRTQEEANANAAAGIGVSNSQHLYGAALDVKIEGGRENYERFARAFNKYNQEHGHPNFRWLGDLPSSSRWRSDIYHFDEGIGAGQQLQRAGKYVPYGTGPGPTKEDIVEGQQDAYKSDANPFLHKKAPASADGVDEDASYKRAMAPDTTGARDKAKMDAAVHPNVKEKERQKEQTHVQLDLPPGMHAMTAVA